MERETAKTDAWGGQAEEALADSLVPTFEAVIPTLWGLPRRNTADGWAGIQVGPSILGSVVGSVTGSVVSPDIDPAAGQASHKINRSRPRKDRMIYSCSLVVILALTAFMEVMKFSESLRACRQNEDWTAEQEYCNGLYLYFIWFPTITKQSLGVFVSLSGFIAFLVRTSRIRRVMTSSQEHGKDATLMPSDDLRSLAGHWTVAASRDSYRETSRLLLGVMVMSTFIGGIASVLMTIVQTLNAVATQSNEDTFGETIRACCHSSILDWDPAVCSSHCLWGYTGFATLLTASMGLFVIMSSSVVFIPAKLWSPITLQAVEKTNDKQMRRLLKLPMYSTIFLVANVFAFVLFACLLFRLDFQWNVTLWEVVLYAMICFLASEIAVLTWVIPWAHIKTELRSIFGSVKAFATSLCGVTAVHPLKEDRAQRWRSLPGQSLECASYRRLVILYVSMYLFGVEGGTWGLNQSIVYPIWFMRLTALVMIILTRDKPVDFEDLQASGAAFGLAINARQLRAAVKAHLEGRKYRGKVHRYKASLLRMSDTMAISYRWSKDVVSIGDGLMVNMTEWQLQELVTGIDRSKCQFVWLDSCSVPQDVLTDLKSILLSRMMAVYASSFVTLVLISQEKETERYHQRMWTLQEFCTSTQLMVATETDDVLSSADVEFGLEAGYTTCAGMEGIHAEAQRAKHLAAQASIVPVWLGDNAHSIVSSIPGSEAIKLWKTFTVLSAKRHCLFQADRVRALYPLVWNRPSESEDELEAFIRAVQEVHGICQQQVIDHLKENRAFSRGVRFGTFQEVEEFPGAEADT